MNDPCWWPPTVGAGCYQALVIVSFGLLGGLSSACAPKTGAPPDGPNAGTTTAGTLVWSRGDWPVELTSDAVWQGAARGDAWALLRLSERRNELKRQVETGGPAAAVALRAWPHAPSAWAERGLLCHVLPSYVAEEWGPLLLALRESSATEDAFGEVLDPGAASACERAFAVLDSHARLMPASVFDEFAATNQAFGRNPPTRTP